MRRITTLILLILVLISSCDTDNGYYYEIDRNIITEEKTVEFEELTLLINIQTPDSKYLVTSSIDSVCIFVNDQYWATTNSMELDTSYIEKDLVENMYVTNNQIDYLIVANQEIEEIELLTAGDYSEYLSAVNTLIPGEYVCLIKSFIITFIDGSRKKFHPYSYHKFTVNENYRSAYVDKITLNI